MSLSGSKILVVDDAADIHILVGHALRSQGAEVDTAANGEEGLRKALSGSYDLILMDIEMPVMDGNQAVAKLRHSGFDGPIVALTGHKRNGDKERYQDLGFTGYLSKEKVLKDLASYVQEQLIVGEQSHSPATIKSEPASESMALH